MTPAAQGTILVVDNDPQVRSLLQRLSARHGHTVAAGADGAEATRQISHLRPDLGATGCRAARHGRDYSVSPPQGNCCHPRPPIVLMSASADLAGP